MVKVLFFFFFFFGILSVVINCFPVVSSLLSLSPLCCLCISNRCSFFKVLFFFFGNHSRTIKSFKLRTLYKKKIYVHPYFVISFVFDCWLHILYFIVIVRYGKAWKISYRTQRNPLLHLLKIWKRLIHQMMMRSSSINNIYIYLFMIQAQSLLKH